MVLVGSELSNTDLTDRMVDDVIADKNQNGFIEPSEVESISEKNDDPSVFHRKQDVTTSAERMAVKVLGEMITNLKLMPSFRSIFHELIKYLKNAKYFDVQVDGKSNDTNLVERQFVLDVVGTEIRKMWGEEDTFQPELLREPYVSRTDRRDYTKSALNQVKEHIKSFVGAMNSGRYDLNVISQFLLFTTEAKDLCLSILHQVKHQDMYVDDANKFATMVGKAMVRLLKNDDVILCMLGNRLDYNKPVNVPLYQRYEMMTPSELEKVNVRDFFNGNNLNLMWNERDSNSKMNSHLPSLDRQRDPDDISFYTEEVNSEYFENICVELSGYFLPKSMRQFIWTYRLLQKSKLVPSTLIRGPPLSKELFRRGASKGISASEIDETIENGPRRANIGSRRRTSSLSQKKESTRNSIKELLQKMVIKYIGAPTNVSDHLEDEKSVDLGQIGSNLGTLAEDKESDGFVAGQIAKDESVEKSASNLSIADVTDMDPREHATLFKRIEHLVFAAYTLNGTLSERSIAVSSLLLKLYPDDSPISEKILQLYQKICDVCLPSEHYNRKYSMANVTQKIWALLGERDPDLYNHLQHYVDTSESMFDVDMEENRDKSESLRSRGRMSRKSVIDFLSSGDSEALKKSQEHSDSAVKSLLPSPPTTAKPDSSFQSSSSQMPPNPKEPKRYASSFPKSFVFLRGWVESGFYAWLPDEAVYFIWDQMTMLSNEDAGGVYTQFERIIIGTSYIILHLCRHELLGVKENLIRKLHWAGRHLRTRVIVKAFRYYFFPDKVFIDRPEDGGGASTLHGSTFEDQGEGKLPLYVSSKNRKNDENNDKENQDEQKEINEIGDQQETKISTEVVGEKTVAYVTDVEGNLEYWDQYIDSSDVIKREAPCEGEVRGLLTLEDNTEVVYGGDVCDRGTGDIRFFLEMLSLKERYPDRVHFILGNRDLNKLRFAFETTEAQLSEPPKCYWLKGPDKGPYDFKADKSEPEGTPDKLSDRVKWMLKKTMGSPDCFEYRKEELGILGTHDDDETVAQSFVDSVRSDGFLTEYLSKGRIAHMIGDTLWVHGAINDLNMGYVPAYNGKEEQKIDNVGDWVEEINSFCAYEIEDYINNVSSYLANDPPSENWAAVGGDHHAQPGSRLLTYGMGFHKDGSKVATAVYANFLDEKGAPAKISNEVSDWLAKGGIHKLIVGHQPHGDCPIVIQCDRGITVCGGDTSYAVGVKYVKNEAMGNLELGNPVKDRKIGAIQKPNTRGVACSDILLYFKEGVSTMRIKGCLNTFQKYDFIFDRKIRDGKKQVVGTPTVDGWWIKGEIPATRKEDNSAVPPAAIESPTLVDSAPIDSNNVLANDSTPSVEEKTKENDDHLPATVAEPTESPHPPAISSSNDATNMEDNPAGYFLCKSEGFSVMNTIVAAEFIDSVLEHGVKLVEE